MKNIIKMMVILSLSNYYTYCVPPCLDNSCPPGSYLNSCTGCSFQNGTLSCACPNYDSSEMNYGITLTLNNEPDRYTVDISNNNGNLEQITNKFNCYLIPYDPKTNLYCKLKNPIVSIRSKDAQYVQNPDCSNPDFNGLEADSCATYGPTGWSGLIKRSDNQWDKLPIISEYYR